MAAAANWIRCPRVPRTQRLGEGALAPPRGSCRARGGRPSRQRPRPHESRPGRQRLSLEDRTKPRAATAGLEPKTCGRRQPSPGRPSSPRSRPQVCPAPAKSRVRSFTPAPGRVSLLLAGIRPDMGWPAASPHVWGWLLLSGCLLAGAQVRAGAPGYLPPAGLDRRLFSDAAEICLGE